MILLIALMTSNNILIGRVAERHRQLRRSGSGADPHGEDPPVRDAPRLRGAGTVAMLTVERPQASSQAKNVLAAAGVVDGLQGAGDSSLAPR